MVVDTQKRHADDITVQELVRLRVEIERLRDDLKHSDEVRQSALQSLLSAENEIERLREALKKIADFDLYGDYSNAYKY
jgi:septal ring factor EnvC (AmiA/AmiB activator)